MFEIIHVSRSIDVDSSWVLVQTYSEKDMQVKHTEEEPIYFDHYDPDALHDILGMQHQISQFVPNHGDKNMLSDISHYC